MCAGRLNVGWGAGGAERLRGYLRYPAAFIFLLRPRLKKPAPPPLGLFVLGYTRDGK